MEIDVVGGFLSVVNDVYVCTCLHQCSLKYFCVNGFYFFCMTTILLRTLTFVKFQQPNPVLQIICFFFTIMPRHKTAVLKSVVLGTWLSEFQNVYKTCFSKPETIFVFFKHYSAVVVQSF